MDLSVIVANWNTRDLLAAGLTSFARHSPAGSIEGRVVDNAARDGSAAWRLALGRPLLILATRAAKRQRWGRLAEQNRVLLHTCLTAPA